MKCTECRYSIETDFGYSNYTVEGTEIDCLLKKNHNFPVDKFYGEEASLEYANECTFFKYGIGVQVDVEQELGELENYSDDIEIKELLKKRAVGEKA